MQFIVIAYDGRDEGALRRRMAAREAHLEQARDHFEQGRWLYAAGILDDEGRPIGSMVVGEFASRADLDERWLRHEPYVLGDVWAEVRVHRAQAAPFRPPASRPGGS